jgi:16S rRNA (uracil1498-N3)-methyltransferase
MSVHDFEAQRLFLDASLRQGAEIACAREQSNYLINVLRMQAGETILVFNGRDGEWRATLATPSRKVAVLVIGEQNRPQQAGPDVVYLFAPLKRSRLDYMVQKAAELGVCALKPVITRRTIAERVNLDRMRANVIEAAEQCGILHIPEIAEPRKLEKVITGWDSARNIVFCDEGAAIANPVAALQTLPRGPIAVLIGPEGGFDPSEREMLLGQPFTLPLSLGPRIMRADTAAIAALTLVNAVLGDWR